MVNTPAYRLRRESGHALITSVIFISITLIFTLGYLSWASHQKVSAKHRYAEMQAKLAARTGISETVYPLTMKTTPPKDTTYGNFALPPGVFQRTNFDKSYTAVATQKTGQGMQNIFYGESIGQVEYTLDSRLGNEERITVTRKAAITLEPNTFSKYLYFTNKEAAGGGAFIFDDVNYTDESRRAVTFGSNENWNGPVHSNDVLTMSDYGCPNFMSEITTSMPNQGGGFNFSSDCGEDEMLVGDDASIDTVDKITYPPPGVTTRLRRGANYSPPYGGVIPGSGSPRVDTLVMTEIEFHEGGFEIWQWGYTIPSSRLIADRAWGCGVAADTNGSDISAIPVPRDSAAVVPTEWYHPEEPMGYFHHFDFPKPDPDDGYLHHETVVANSRVIFVDGQVLVHGVVDGQFTVATSEETRYSVRNPIFGSGTDLIYNNIWIIDDIKYIDSLPNGQVIDGSPNRLGLISGANVIIANTRANGAAGGQYDNSDGVIINAGIMALNESFMAHYWQNTVSDDDAYLPNLGDARGPMRVNNGVTTGNSDDRGDIHLWGSIVQEYRGYVRRNYPGPYNTGNIGYGKDYHYDWNFQISPPPLYPVIRTESGYTDMKVTDLSVEG